MADVDTSSYPRPQAQQNPLDMITKIGQVADTLGNFEVGKATQGAIGEDGEINRNKLAQALRQTQVGSMKAIPTLDALEKLRQAGHTADQAGLENFQKRMAVTNHLFSGLASKDNPTMDDVYDVAAKVMDPGLNAKKFGLTVPVIMNALKSFRGPDGKPLPPAQIKAKALEIQTQAAATSEILGQHSPQVRAVQTPQGIQFQPGGSAANPAFNQTPTAIPPTQEVVDTNKFLPDGTPNPNYGQKKLYGVEENPAGPKPLPSARPVRQATEGITGVQYGDTTNPQNGKVLKKAELATSLAPGDTTPLTASAEVYAKDLNDSRNYGERMNPLRQAIPLLEKLGPTGSGPGQETIQHIKSFAQTLGLPVPNDKSITNYAEAKKYLAQNAATVAPPGTNIPSVLNAMEANPNMSQPQAAAVDLSKMLYGLGRMRQASVLAFRATGLPASQYTDWASKWSKDQDPRAYTADLMSPEQRAELAKKLKPGSEQAKKFRESYQTVKSLGLLGDVERETK
jgi:hypothetical protein